MKENDEESNSSDNSAISVEGDFKTLNINNQINIEDEIKNNNNFNNQKINSDESRKSYKSIISFSVISKNGDNNINDTDSYEQLNLEDNQSGLDIRTSEVNNNNNSISFWEAVKQQLSNFKNQIIFNYNLFTGLNNLKLNAPGLPKVIQLFDETYSKQDDKLINKLKNIPWFSYRKDFDQIKDNDIVYSSDAGWGCMIRASQMILAQGLFKLYSLKNIESFVNEFISYFYDNKIPIKLLSKSKDNKVDKLINTKNDDKKEKKDETFDDFLILDIFKESRMSFVDISMEMIKGLENMSDRNSNQKYITSPFSLRNYVKIEKKINPKGKKVGQWFSNYDVIEIITEINRQMYNNNDCDFNIVNFNDGTIFLEDIIKKCFKEQEKKRESQGFEILSLSYLESSEILLDEKTINKDLKNEVYVFNKKRFLFDSKFIIFISVRHGLYNLDDELYDDILNLFNIKTNIGLIGGKSSRAFYFIGRCGQNLIFLDPHYVQPTIPLNQFGTDSIQETYRPNNIYYMPINDLSPCFSIGFAINDMKSFKLFMEDIHSFGYFIDKTIPSNSKINVFNVKNFHLKRKKQDDEFY